MLSDDGLAEPQQEQARGLAAITDTARAVSLDDAALADLEARLGGLSDAIARATSCRVPSRCARPASSSRDALRDPPVTPLRICQPVGFARCNLRLKPIFWSGQEVEDYALTVEPGGRTSPARAEAGLANVVRLVVEAPARALTDHEQRARPRRPADPRSAPGRSHARRGRRAGARQPRHVAGEPRRLSLPLAADPARPRHRRLVRARSQSRSRRARGGDRARPADPARVRVRSDATLVDTPPHEAFAQRGGVCQDFAQIMISGCARRAARRLCLGLSAHAAAAGPATRLVAPTRRTPGCCCGADPTADGSAWIRPTASGWRATMS